jgi:uncharacterized protein CbrC (UPF0167 family)
MIKCYNCGAEIDENMTECPYCNASQSEAAEKKYMDDLYSMNDTMDRMDDNALKTELKTTVKRVLVMVGIFAVCIFIGTIIGTVEYKSYHDSSKERKEIIAAYDWYDNNIDSMNALYESRDFDAIYDIYNSGDYSTVHKAIKNWEHYSLFSLHIYYYSRIQTYMESETYLKYESSYVSAYRESVEFASYRSTYVKGSDVYEAMPQEDVEISAEWLENVENFVYEKLKVTEEEFQKDVKNYSSYSYDDMKNIAGVYYLRFQQN